MKDIYKNPILYYILTPVIIALWPLLIGTVYLSKTEDVKEFELSQYEKGIKVMTEIVKIDPGRLAFADSNDKAAVFDYTVAINDIASRYGISSSDYKINSGMPITSGKQKSQSADVVLKEVDIATFSEFLSALQLRWANLQCTQVKLSRKKGLSNTWKVNLDFKYYY